jgi:hypothetical protein
MHEESQGPVGESRRDFLKKAGAVAWVVPTLQVVNMASAAAGDVGGSVVSTTRPPSTTTTTTTTEPPECTEYVYYRLKADWDGSKYVWKDGIGANDCIKEGTSLDGDALGAAISVSGTDREATITHTLDDCEIMKAAHKAGQACIAGTVAADGSYAMFSAGADGQAISHVEILVKCCVRNGDK